MMTATNGGVEMPSAVLLATDGSPGAALAVRKAVAISEGTGAELHVAHVWHEIPSAHYERFIERELKRKGREVLEAAAQHVESIGGRVAGSHLAEGRSVEGILGVREKVGADVIVVGSRGLGAVRSAIMGSVSMELVRRAPCPVLVVHGEEELSPESKRAGASEKSAK